MAKGQGAAKFKGKVVARKVKAKKSTRFGWLSSRRKKDG